MSITTDQLSEQRRLVDIDHYDITVREIVRMSVDNELVRAPEYQRKFRWSEYDESRLIESVFLGLPVPTIYVATNANGSWDLVDGLQRVSTLLHFTLEPDDAKKLLNKEPLRLTDLEKLSDFNDKIFKQLSIPHQHLFLKRPLRITALNDKSDESVRFEMFDRLNRGGIALTDQEVRACIYRGQFSSFLKELSETSEFKALVKLQLAAKNDGTMEELVLKFFAYLHHREQFKQKVNYFLNQYMVLANTSFDYKTEKALFDKTVAYLSRVFDGKAFLRRGVNVTPLNQLEAAMVAAAEIYLSGETPVENLHPNWTDDEELVKFSTKGTNAKKSLAGRIERAKAIFSGETVVVRK